MHVVASPTSGRVSLDEKSDPRKWFINRFWKEKTMLRPTEKQRKQEFRNRFWVFLFSDGFQQEVLTLHLSHKYIGFPSALHKINPNYPHVAQLIKSYSLSYVCCTWDSETITAAAGSAAVRLPNLNSSQSGRYLCCCWVLKSFSGDESRFWKVQKIFLKNDCTNRFLYLSFERWYRSTCHDWWWKKWFLAL